MSFRYSPKTVTDGLVLYLDAANPKSYVSGSNSWKTLSKSGVNGNLINGPTFSSSNGGSIVFDSTDDYVRIGTGSDWYPMSNSAFTFDVWIKSMGLGSGMLSSGIISLGYGLTFNITSLGKLQTLVYDVITSGISYTTTVNVNVLDNNWHHAVATNDGLTTKIYVDGVFNVSSSATFYGDIKSSWYSSNFAIGLDANNPSISRFKGSISDVKVYNKALSVQEVLQNYNTKKSKYR
jgi:hypothetical protein